MAYVLSPIMNGVPVIDANGNPVSGGKIYTYLSGTSTPTDTWTNSSGSVLNSNPIILNASGYPVTAIWLDEAVSYRFYIKDASDNFLLIYDNIRGVVPGVTTNFPPVANVSMGGFNITNLGTADSGDDALSRDAGDARYQQKGQSGATLTGLLTTQFSFVVPGSINANTTIDATYNGKFIVVDSGSAVALTLADANAAGFWCVVLRKGSGALTIGRQTTGTINGGTSAKTVTSQWNIAFVHNYAAGAASVTLAA